MTPEITPANATDLPAIFALLDANRLPRAGLEAYVASTLVVREDGDIVGTAALELYGRSALLRSVAVAAALRGGGVGHALTAAALDLARRRGVRTVYLLTETAGKLLPQVRVSPYRPRGGRAGRARVTGIHDRLPEHRGGYGDVPSP